MIALQAVEDASLHFYQNKHADDQSQTLLGAY